MQRSSSTGRMVTLAALLVVLILSACTVEKSDSPDPVRVGSELTYTIEFSEIPSSPDAQKTQSDSDRLIEPSGRDPFFLRVIDELPSDVVFISVDPDANCDHAGGIVMHGFADGHVIGITDSINANVYMCITSRADGESFDNTALE